MPSPGRTAMRCILEISLVMPAPIGITLCPRNFGGENLRSRAIRAPAFSPPNPEGNSHVLDAGLCLAAGSAHLPPERGRSTRPRRMFPTWPNVCVTEIGNSRFRLAVGRGSRSPPHPSPFQGEGGDCGSLGIKCDGPAPRAKQLARPRRAEALIL